MSPDQQPHPNDLWWNVLTFITLGTLVLVLVVMVVIFRDPTSGVNPFPPPTATIPPPTPTVTPSPIVLPEIWTSTPPVTAATLRPSITPAMTQMTVTMLANGELGVPSPTVRPNTFAYQLKASASAIDGAAFHPEWGCAWMGVAGQAEDWLDRPARGIQIKVGGQIGDRTVDITTLSGTALQYGPAGYEFKLANGPYETDGALWIQLFDQAGQPLSKRTYFDTVGECEHNLIILNFNQPG